MSDKPPIKVARVTHGEGPEAEAALEWGIDFILNEIREQARNNTQVPEPSSPEKDEEA